MKTYLNYNEANLRIVAQIILRNLTPDLLPKKWVTRNGDNPMFGHCHNASGCLYKVFGPKAVKMYRAVDYEGTYHWWVKDLDGKIIDITSEQYTSVNQVPPHDKGEKAGLLGFEYGKRVQRLYERVISEYEDLEYLSNHQ